MHEQEAGSQAEEPGLQPSTPLWAADISRGSSNRLCHNTRPRNSASEPSQPALRAGQGHSCLLPFTLYRATVSLIKNTSNLLVPGEVLSPGISISMRGLLEAAERSGFKLRDSELGSLQQCPWSQPPAKLHMWGSQRLCGREEGASPHSRKYNWRGRGLDPRL